MFEKVIKFSNFSLKYGYSTKTETEYDVMILSASKVKISFHFITPESKPLFSKFNKIFTKYCIKSNLLGYYKVIKPLGKGGFATVYLMRHKTTKKTFAVKIIKKASIKSTKELRYIKSEVGVLRIMDHPNIVKTYEVHELEKYLAIVQDYLDGDSLRGYMKNRVITEYNAIQIIHELLLALSYMHKMNLIHRDLKPGNIMLRRKRRALRAASKLTRDTKSGRSDGSLENVVSSEQEGGEKFDASGSGSKGSGGSGKGSGGGMFTAEYTVILIDFGLCARADDFSKNSFLRDRSGTVGYLAPELIEKDSLTWYNQKVDIYSLGIVLVEL